MAAPLAFAQDILPGAARTADVVFLGEQHDNPGHHAVQAKWTAALAPSALVFEMLTPQQAARVTADVRRSQAALGSALEWDGSGWPDFALYYPIFEAAPAAEVYGAGVPRAEIRGVMQQDIAQIFGPQDAARFGLDVPLDATQQAAREQMQADAHCNALPADMLPMMVSVQRLRDATLARAALEAVEDTGGPVIVITGNGHARTDWGAPLYLQTAAPGLSVFALGQGENGRTPPGGFTAMADGPAVTREDPCDVFN
ncbi:ChaN family lipoprotein [uncultured Roseobacter sp.]|uniref:ChaN family lipoprotein n=1 Tax=uncultured Roseobacter sp. TaxID=114847 RepID=UPI00262AD3BD|nr:ChaN family lipoprotein [uncultured Roseobacter sp.]